MAEEGLKQRLAAILAADAAGYSRQMAADEHATITALDTARRVFRTHIEANRGRVVDMAGDSVLAVFETATGATMAALAAQRQLERDSSDHPNDGRLRFRIGVHLGDVIEKADGTVYGDGVNVASRLQAIAEAGGIAASELIRAAVKDRVGAKFEDRGEHRVKNIDEPVRAYRVVSPSATPEQPAPSADAREHSYPAKPSIAILAFENMSSDPEYGYFGDGLAEDIITALSKISNLFVIARNSSFAYKGKAVEVRKIARELGVRYVLEGSVRATKKQLRVTGQLIDGTDGHHVWAERYDRNLDDIFRIQDEIMREVVTALLVQVSDGEAANAMIGGTSDVQAWTDALAGRDLVNSVAPGNNAKGRALLEKAISRDPGYVSAIGLIASSHLYDCHFSFTGDRERSLRLAEEYTERASNLEPDLSLVRCLKGLCASYRGRHDEAVREGKLAVHLGPSDDFATVALGRILVDAGRPAEGETYVREAMRLNPFYPVFYDGILANALELQARDQEAIEILERAVSRQPNYFSGHLRLAGMLGRAGRLERAKRHGQEALRINPRFDAAAAKAYYVTADADAYASFIEGLRKAGIVLDVQRSD